jgi:hypothetical protein
VWRNGEAECWTCWSCTTARVPDGGVCGSSGTCAGFDVPDADGAKRRATFCASTTLAMSITSMHILSMKYNIRSKEKLFIAVRVTMIALYFSNEVSLDAKQETSLR